MKKETQRSKMISIRLSEGEYNGLKGTQLPMIDMLMAGVRAQTDPAQVGRELIEAAINASDNLFQHQKAELLGQLALIMERIK